jgi:hypothetical protein
MKNWTDKDGNARKSAEIFVNNIQFMDDSRQRISEPVPLRDEESLAPALAQ